MLTSLRAATHLAALLIAAAGSQAHAQAGRAWTDPPADLGAGRPPAVVPPPAAPAAPPAASAAPPSAAAPPAPSRSAPAEPAPMVRSARPEPPPAAAPAARQALPEPPPARSAQPAPPARTNGSAAPQDPRSTAGIERPRGVEDDRRPDRGRLAAREDAARDLVHDYLDLWSAPNPLTLAGSVDFYAPSVIFHGRAMSARALLEEKRRFVQRWPERRYRPRPETTGVACGPNGDTCTVRSVFDFTATDPERGRRSQGVATLELVVSFREDERPVITAENSLVHGRSRGSGFAAGGLDDEP